MKNFKCRKIRSAGLFLAGASVLFLAPEARADTFGGTINATITLVKSCSINGTPAVNGGGGVNFGTLDFGSQSTLFDTADAQVSGSAAGIAVVCSPGATPYLEVNSGTNDNSGSHYLKLTSDPTQTIPYVLYSDSGRSAEIVNNSTQLTPASGVIQVYGRATGGASSTLKAGTYTDTINVTLTF